MGRTKWDRAIVSFLSPNASYYYCGEVLRPPFYEDKNWHINTHHDRFILVSTISKPLYKGFDLILKTAAILSNVNSFSFEWQVFGNVDVEITERRLKIRATQHYVIMKGVVSAESLANVLLNADVFIHPSYIDNSPNSVCEAQILGVPVISTNVGGIASLIEHMTDGILIPANDPFALAAAIILLYKNPQIAENIGKKGKSTAEQRHDPATIVNSLLNIYNDVISKKGISG
jgi:glycosyltransferase involved in cell wall biosynthesis